MLVNSVKPKTISKPLAYRQYIKSKIISNNMDSEKESGDRYKKDLFLQPKKPAKKM